MKNFIPQNNSKAWIYFLYLFSVIGMIISNIPLFNISFQQDELDILSRINLVTNIREFWQFSFTHHNEHLSYITYAIYFILYKLFGFNIAPFAILSLLTNILTSYIIYLFVLKLWKSPFIALISAFAFNISNVFILLEWKLVALQLGISNLFMLLILFFFLKYSLLSQIETNFYKYCLLFLISVLSLGTFGSSLIIFPLAPAFAYLILYKSERVNKKVILKYLFIIFAGSIVGFSLWFIKDSGGLHAEHYKSIGKTSALQALNIYSGSVNSIKAMLRLTIKFFHPYLSVIVLFVMGVSLVRNFRILDYRYITFFLIYIFLSFFIALAFRSDWDNSYTWSRYYLIPASGYCMLVVCIMKKEVNTLIKKNINILFTVLLIVGIIQISLSYQKNLEIKKEYLDKKYDSLEKLKIEYNDLKTNYRGIMKMADVSKQITKSENIVKLSQYIKIIEPNDNIINWSETVDPDLKKYITENSEKYKIFSSLILESK